MGRWFDSALGGSEPFVLSFVLYLIIIPIKWKNISQDPSQSGKHIYEQTIKNKIS